MKDVGYFSHDSNAQHDPKIIKMLAKHGWESYGLFWGIVEKLRNETDYILETDYESIAYAMRTQCDLVKSIIEDFGLFIVEDGFFHSKRLDQCMQLKEEKSEKARQSSLKRWKNNANAMRTDTERNAIKGKVSKINKEKKGKDIKSLKSINQDYLNELQEKHIDIDVPFQFKKFKDYLSSKGKTYKDYRAGFRNWLNSGFCEKTDKIKNERFEQAQKDKVRKLHDDPDVEYATDEERNQILNRFKSIGKGMSI